MPHASAESIHLIIDATRSPVGTFAGPLIKGVAAADPVRTWQTYLHTDPNLELTPGPGAACP